MAVNPYDMWNPADLDEEILREERQRTGLVDRRASLEAEINDLRGELLAAEEVVQSTLYVRGRAYPFEAYSVANDYIFGRIGRSQLNRQMARYGISAGTALQIVGAIQHFPETVETGLTYTRDEAKLNRINRRIERRENRIANTLAELTDIDEQLRLKRESKERRRRGYTVWDITKYFIYDEPGGIHHAQSPRVRFEVRCQNATIPSIIEIDDTYLENRLEPIFDRALEEFGRWRRRRTEITMGQYRDYQRGRARRPGWSTTTRRGRYYLETREQGLFINVDAFRKEFFTAGLEEVGVSDVFQSVWNFSIVKYRLPGNTLELQDFISLNVSENQVS